MHSGDSMAIYHPRLNLTEEEVDTLVDYTTRIGLALGVRGLMNIQFVLQGGSAYRSPSVNSSQDVEPTTVYVLEVNPRGSRTIPFISKVTGVPLPTGHPGHAGRQAGRPGLRRRTLPRQKLVGIKAPVFSMSKLVGVDWYMGAGDETHRGGDGHRLGFRGSANQGVAGRQHQPVSRHGRAAQHLRPRQGGLPAFDPRPRRRRVSAIRHRGHPPP